jgi:hypothetical protein
MTRPNLIEKRTLTSKSSPKPDKEGVASILDRDVAITMRRWLSRVEQVSELSSLPLRRNNELSIFPR